MDHQAAPTTGSNGESTLHDLFALTDEQILEIEPEARDVHAEDSAAEAQSKSNRDSPPASQAMGQRTSSPSAPRNDGAETNSRNLALTSRESPVTSHEQPVTSHDSAEPPPWLAAQMKDPWNGEEAKELWNGVQHAKQEAAAYRAAFATPEDARALKELYPGGVSEARAAAERARVLDDIDRAYFGASGKSAQEVSASRAQLAQTMLREDPAAFRAMVFEGLRALEGAGKQENRTPLSTVGSSAATDQEAARDAVLKPAATENPHESPITSYETHLAAYASFEKAANEELERSVGGAIERTLQQALPILSRSTQDASSRAGQAPPLQARLSAAIRQDVEAALKGDRQLGEQVAQILSGRRFNEEARGQVVRVIGERAHQLVPVAAKRVLNDWTQTTLAAHRARGDRSDAASARREVSPASTDSRGASLPAGSSASSRRNDSQDPNRGAARSDTRRVDYRKLSDEQILEM